MEIYSPDVFISEERIAARVKELGDQISEDFEGREVIIICVLKGAFMFCSDLIKQVNLPLKLDFVTLSSYGDDVTSSGNVKVVKDIDINIEGKEVIVVEDIVDTGLTLNQFIKLLAARNPNSISVASLLHKPSKTEHDVPIRYLGFEIEDKFVIGYGLDYAGQYRELPYIGVLNQSN